MNSRQHNDGSDYPATGVLEETVGISRPLERSTSIISPNNSDSSLCSLSWQSTPKKAGIVDSEGNDAFNLTELSRATAPVENSIAFPIIEWDDECDTHSEESNHNASHKFPARPDECQDNDDDDEDEGDESIVLCLGSSRKRTFGGKRNLPRSKARKSGLNHFTGAQTCDSSSELLSNIPIVYGPASEALDRQIHKKQHLRRHPKNLKKENESTMLLSRSRSWEHFVIPDFDELFEQCKELKFSVNLSCKNMNSVGFK